MTWRMRWRRVATACGLALVITTGVTTPVQAAPSDHAATQAVLDQYRQKAGPGAAVHAGNGTGAWTLSSGSASISAQRAITASDHYRIGSQTKTFTASVVLQLVDEGRVQLDAPIERYLPGVVTGNYNGNVITVRQLLQHTSGMARDVKGAAANPDGTYSLAALVRAAMDDPAQFAPGAGWGYSNTGYLVIGMLIERITGQRAGDAITDRIIKPLGLTHTSFPEPGVRALPSPYLPGYQGGRLGPIFFWVEATTISELSQWSTAGAMASTMDDMAAFYRAVADRRVFSAAALAEMRRTTPVTPGSALGYGLGLFRLPLSCGGDGWGHDGVLTTGHATITLVTDDDRFATVVTNAPIAPSAPSSGDVANSALCEGNS